MPQQWIFGGLCKELNHMFLVEFPDRKASTLLNIVRRKVLPFSVIVSDCWKAHRTEAAGYRHLTVNRRYYFVDANTQSMERMWGSLKWRNKRQRGMARHHLESCSANVIPSIGFSTQFSVTFRNLCLQNSTEINTFQVN